MHDVTILRHLGSMGMSHLLLVACAATVQPPNAVAQCDITVQASSSDDGALSATVAGRATGVLNGLNGTLPTTDFIKPYGFSMWRGPIAGWLWPGRGNCTDLMFGVPGCCDEASCLPPFTEVAKLQSIGLRQQYILDGIHYGQTACEWISFNRKMHSCPLPGGPNDRNYSLWTGSIRAAIAETKRQQMHDVYYDVWNEPNGQSKVQCLADHGDSKYCSYDANLTQTAFLGLYDAAVRLIRTQQPTAKIVAPSIADGGPGINGWSDVLPWLQAFLLHGHASNTLPDVLSWHVTDVGANTSLLAEQHRTLKAWAATQNIPLPPIGHNEMVGPSETLLPAANLAFVVAAETLELEHTCRACWTDPVTKQSPCVDNSLDALLVNDCTGPLDPECAPLTPRSNSFVYRWYADAKGSEILQTTQSAGCEGNTVVMAVSPGHNESVTVMVGRWTDSTPRTPPLSPDIALTVTLTEVQPTSCWRVAIEWVPNSARLAGKVVTSNATYHRAIAGNAVTLATIPSVLIHDVRRIIATHLPSSSCDE